MTRKDYVPIAAILRQAASKPEYRQRTWIVSRLADYLESENPRFDRMRFILACATEQDD